MVHCPNCGYENDPARTICQECSATLPVDGAPAEALAPEMPVPASGGPNTRWLFLAWMLAMGLGGALLGIGLQLFECGRFWLATPALIGILAGAIGLVLFHGAILRSLLQRKTSWARLSAIGSFLGVIAALFVIVACFAMFRGPGILPLVELLDTFSGYAMPGFLAFGLVIGAAQARALPAQPNRAWWLPTTTASMFLIVIGMSLARHLLVVLTGSPWCGVGIGGIEPPLTQVLWLGIGGLVGGTIGLLIGALTGDVLFWLVRLHADAGTGTAHPARWLPRLTTIGILGFSLLFWYPIVRVQNGTVQLHMMPCWYTGPINGYGLGLIYPQPTANDRSNGNYQPLLMRCSDKLVKNDEGRWRLVVGIYGRGWVLDEYLQIGGATQPASTAANQPSEYELRRIATNGGAVIRAGWEADGQHVFALTSDNGLHLWNIERPHETRRVDQASGVLLDAVLSPDAQMFLVADQSETPQLIDSASGQEIRRFKHSVMLAERITSVAFSPDGRSALTVWTDGYIRVWDRASGTKTLDLWGHEWISSGAYTPDGQTIVSAQFGRGLQLWDVQQGKELRLLGPACYQVTSMAISPDGKTIVSGSAEGSVCTWDLASGRELGRFKMHAKSVTSLAFSPDGHSVLSGAADGTIVLWDLASGRTQRSLTGQSNIISSLAFHPNGKTALSASWDGTLRVWRIE